MSDLSARNVGDSVQTLGRAAARASKCSWAETVRYLGFLKKWADSVCPIAAAATGETVKTSPAPSQSEEVMMGVWH